MKEVKNTNELINYLISKGVKVNNIEIAKENIENYTYYGIVNTYKEIFKNKDNTYKNNVSFEEIFALYKFDMNIKAIFLKYILEIELIIKSKIANLFTEKYGIKDYLDINNFENNSKNTNKITELINNINSDIDNNYLRHDALAHYKNNYGFIPMFVLIKTLSFGTISRFYGLMKQRDQQKISKTFGIPSNALKQILKNLTFVRNISAHSDRLYSYRYKYTISISSFNKTYKLPNNTNNLYVMILSIKQLLSNEKYEKFKNEFDIELKKLSQALKSISIKEISNIMGIVDE